MEALRLEPWRPEDYSIYAAMAADGRVMAYISGHALNDEEIRVKYDNVLEKYPHGMGHFMVYQGDRFIGYGKLTPMEDPGVGEVGYMLPPELWGQGYGNAIAALMVAQARAIGLHTTAAVIDPANIASRRVLEKQGFTTHSPELYHSRESEWLQLVL